MTHKKLLLLAAFVALLGSASVGSGAYARNGSDDTSGSSRSGREATVTTTTETENETETETETELEHPLTETQKQKVQEHRSEIKARLEAKKAEVTAKLEGKRLATCEKRQETINKIIAKATEQNKKQLAVFQKIEQRVKDFYTSRNLVSDGYDEAVKTADDTEAKAVAAIESSSAVTFDCSATDATQPGSVVKAAMEARHSALKDYRTAVKDLILVVKKHHGQQQSSDSDTDTDNSTDTTDATNNPDTSTGGV